MNILQEISEGEEDFQRYQARMEYLRIQRTEIHAKAVMEKRIAEIEAAFRAKEAAYQQQQAKLLAEQEQRKVADEQLKTADEQLKTADEQLKAQQDEIQKLKAKLVAFGGQISQ